MGQQHSRVIKINNIKQQLNKCELISQQQCNVYGLVNFIHYNGMNLYMGQSITNNIPPLYALHYLIQPNLLLIPQFILLENMKPKNIEEILGIISGVVEISTSYIGIGKNRLAYAGRWGIVGQNSSNWIYKKVLSNQFTNIYISPQLMISYAQKLYIPKHNPIKSDVFALGVMILEIIFQENFRKIYNFQKFQIHLKPLVHHLKIIKQQYGVQIYQLFVDMLQIDQERRYDYNGVLDKISNILLGKNVSSFNSGWNSINKDHLSEKKNKQQQIYFKTPPNKTFKKQQKNIDSNTFCNNVSPFRGRFGNRFQSGQPKKQLPSAKKCFINMKQQRIKPSLNKQNKRLSPLAMNHRRSPSYVEINKPITHR